MNLTPVQDKHEQQTVPFATLTFHRGDEWHSVNLETITIDDADYLRIAKESGHLFGPVYAQAADYLKRYKNSCARVVSTDVHPPSKELLLERDLIVLTVGTYHDRHTVLQSGITLPVAYRFRLLTGENDFGRAHYCKSDVSNLGPIVTTKVYEYTGSAFWQYGL